MKETETAREKKKVETHKQRVLDQILIKKMKYEMGLNINQSVWIEVENIQRYRPLQMDGRPAANLCMWYASERARASIQTQWSRELGSVVG